MRSEFQVPQVEVLFGGSVPYACDVGCGGYGFSGTKGVSDCTFSVAGEMQTNLAARGKAYDLTRKGKGSSRLQTTAAPAVRRPGGKMEAAKVSEEMVAAKLQEQELEQHKVDRKFVEMHTFKLQEQELVQHKVDRTHAGEMHAESTLHVEGGM